MIKVRKANKRGSANYGWLDTHYTFSFSDYYDPRFMGFRDLRVINEDYIAPAQGFPKHGHRDMEIITYVISGELSHRDSIGNGETIRPHEVQRMTAGTGVLHSEYSSPTDKTHLLQIWILPETVGLEPSYEQKAFAEDERRGQLRLIASGDGRDGSVTVHQDVSVFASILGAGESIRREMDQTRYGWIQVARGEIKVNGQLAGQGDGAIAMGESSLEIVAEKSAEILLFDLA